MNNPYASIRQNIDRSLFIPFTVVGDPNKSQSVEIINTLVTSGADALELGFPYSDPPADGPTIQAADKRALDAGIKIDDCFEIIKTVRESHDLPIGLLVYFNIVMKRGIHMFYADCKDAGVTSVLIADLPLEHATECIEAANRHDIQPVFMVSELTTDERLQKICEVAKGYLYLVSYVGITGIQDGVMSEHIKNQIQRIRMFSNIPICVGFGVNTPSQVKAVADAGADGVIVGSRIVKEIPNIKAIEHTCKELRSAL